MGTYMDGYLEYVEKAQDRELVLFGAGERMAQIMDIYYKFDEIAFCCDNDAAKWGKKKYNVPVCPPEKLLGNPDRYVVIITPRDDFAVKRIKQQLMGMEIPYFYEAAVLEHTNLIERFDAAGNRKFHELRTFKKMEEHAEKLAQVREMLWDEKSKDVWDAFVFKMKYNISNYADIADDLYEHYFSDGIFAYGDAEVLVDGGAFDGDDTIWFAQMLLQQGKKLKKSYCFEPDASNFANTAKNLAGYFHTDFIRAEEGLREAGEFAVYRAGLFDKNQNIEFLANGNHSSRFIENRNACVGGVRKKIKYQQSGWMI